MRVVIVEDSDLIHASLCEVLADCAGVEVVGRAVGEDEAVALIGTERPDVVLLDLLLNPGSGLSVLRRVRDGATGTRILVLSNEVGRAVRVRCIEEGADGFFDKCNELGAMIACLQQDAPASPGVAVAPVMAAPDPRSALDAIVAKAAALTGCPMAAVTLVGTNRQWLLAREGLDFARASRGIAFCAHAIAGRELLEVRDASTDPRFSRNPLVREPFDVRYYAGMPLVLSSGSAVGALCVLDVHHHALDDAQRLALGELARQAAEHVEALQLEALAEQAVRSRRCGTSDNGSGIDLLTHLPDRTAAVQAVEEWLDLRAPGAPAGAVLAIGLDRLSWINHTFGRSAGDMLLREVARRIEAAVVGRGHVARIGGDEFGVVLQDVADEAEALVAGEEIAHAIGAPLLAGGTVLRLRCSVGMALAGGAREAEPLLGQADVAMNHAKKLGGNLCQLFTEWMGGQACERVMREHELRRAIARGELVLDFQPQVELGSSSIAGVEALVRWEHPVRGRLYPDRFIALAEESGLIRELGAQVLDLALAQLATWRDAGLPLPQMAVNVSPRQLDASFVATVRDALARHAIAPSQLELELTESTLAQDDVAAREALQALHALGVSIAVDDFGIGYSSLAALHRLPVTTLKIDRSFISDIDSTQAMAIVQAVIALARALGLRTVAEGVELPSQAHCISTLGCDRAQGYLYCRPVASTVVTELLRQGIGAGPAADAPVADTSVSCGSASAW